MLSDIENATSSKRKEILRKYCQVINIPIIVGIFKTIEFYSFTRFKT